MTIDTTALRTSGPFRRVFGAQLASSIGTQVTLVALMLQVYHLTHSSLSVGLLGAFMVGPTLLLALLGGAMVDVVRNVSQLSDADRHAMAVYIKSLAPPK